MTTSAPHFIPGLTLNRRFYWEIVRALLDQQLPHLNHSAALMGYGSDVFGYDTPISTDHNWGPRFTLLLSPSDHAEATKTLNEMLRANLPPTFLGYSVHYTEPNLSDSSTQRGTPHTGGPINHLITITTVDEFFQSYLGVTPNQELNALDWLTLPEQKLLEATAGEVFHDGLGTLIPARERFAYYPDDVWKLKLAAGWQRIAAEEAFVGRTGDLGDEIGSWILSARITREIIRLSFLYARRYAPYSKWLGTAFNQLSIASALQPHIHALAQANHWHQRQEALIGLYALIAAEHNNSGLTEPLTTSTRDYFGRPYQVLFAGRFASAIKATIQNESLRNLSSIGAVDQFTDSEAIDSSARLAAKLKSIYLT